MELKINGKRVTVADNPSIPLLWVLRDELGMTGTKFGCGVGICGACTVHVDGVAARACITPVETVAGKEIRTIEGLAAENGELHPVQRAFIEEQVPQCGWCMSGQIMTAVSFIESTPNPTPEQIIEAMGNNYCRCGCYTRIYTAVAKAAEMAGEENT
ncbi:MAG: (2Fe-2S)-binding protein [Candidatus Promineifilaceae bacterium]